MTIPHPNGVSAMRQTIEVSAPTVQTAPLVLSSPHSGRDYPADFLMASKLDPLRLRCSEDSFVDEMFGAAPRNGAPLLRALFPRAYLDPNREPWELDPDMFDEPLPSFVNTTSRRVQEGFGTIARKVTGGAEIYCAKLRFDAAAKRIRTLYMPYHDTLKQMIEKTRERFGFAILIDCHSMPSLDGQAGCAGARRRADFVLGDRYGVSCAPALTHRAEVFLRRLGYSVERNHPFAGAFITAHYGKPSAHVHALQIEVNRALYMDEGRIARSSGFETVAAHLGQLIGELAKIRPHELAGQA